MKKIPGTQLTVQNIFCIGRNYIQHAKELGNTVPSEPVVFLKPTSSVIFNGDTVVIPKNIGQVDHEVEVVIVIGKHCKSVEERFAWDYVEGIGVGLDLTARDLQTKAKEMGLPWSVAKGFDTFAVLSSIVSVPEPDKRRAIEFSLSVDGVMKQKGNTSEMIFSIPQIISYLSTVFTLRPGDLVYTGTPMGVGAIHAGERLLALLENRITLEVGVQNSLR